VALPTCDASFILLSLIDLELTSLSPCPQDMTEADKNVPSELLLNKKWDWAVTEVGYKMAVGTVVAGVTAAVLARGPKMRTAITMFGTGFGAGWSFKIVNDSFSSVAKK